MKQKYFYSILLLFLSFLGFSQTLDQSNTSSNAGQLIVNPNYPHLAQSFTNGLSGTLSRVSVEAQANVVYPTIAGDFELTIYDGEGIGGTVLLTHTFSVTDNFSGELIIDFSPVPVTSGSVNTFKISPAAGSPGRLLLSMRSGNLYGGGILYNGNFGPSSDYDLWFKTFVNVPTAATHLNFDGTNDFVNLGTTVSSALNGSTALTLEAWINPSVLNGWNNIITDYNGTYNKFLLRVRNNNNVQFVLANGTFLNSLITIPLNTWTHIAAVYDGANMYVYVNGNLIASQAAPASLPSGTPQINIGSRIGSNTENFTGDIDEVRVWNVARTPEQINGSMNCELQGTESGLVAYYNFNQGIEQADNSTITTLTDVSSNSNDGTLTNFTLNGATSNWLAGSPVTTGSVVPGNASVTTPVNYTQGDTPSALTATTGINGNGLMWYTSATGGTGSTTAPTPSTTTVGSTSYWVSSTNANGCESERMEIVVNVNAPIPATHLNFDGTNDFVAIASPFTGYTNEISVEFWVNRNGNITTGSGIGQSGNTDSMSTNVWLIHGNSNNTFTFYVNEGGAWRDSGASSVIPLNTWTHVAAVADASGVRIYVNGVLSNNTTTGITTSILANPTAQLHIGKDSRFAAGIGRNFNGSFDEVRVWNTARTTEEINGSMNCELQGSESGLVMYYQFNQGADQSDNTSITTLTATAGNGGTLSNFTLNGATSNWLAGSPVTTGSLVPGNPTVTTPVTYNEGDTASALSATTGTNGTGLLWYTSATGGTGSTTAPTPSTASAGSTSYWVSSTNANGCESERVEIVVNVNAAATHLNFDGSNDTVVSANAITNNTENQTYQVWFRIPSIPTNNDRILQRGSDGSGGWSVQLDVNSTGRLSAGISASTDIYLTGTTVLTPNTWYHATFVFENNNSLRLYLNGNLEASVAIGFRILRNSDNRLRVGSGNIASEFFNGDIDEVRVWNIALSQTDIMNTMNCELDNGETNLMVYYKFNQGFDASNNTGVTTANDSSGNVNNGTLTGFALTGVTSNWASGSAMTTGNTCSIILNSDDFEVANFGIYPNPTNGIVNIKSDIALTIEIYDLLGKRIVSKKINSGIENIDITNYPSGIYLLKSTNDLGNSKTYKIIKK